VVAQASAFHTVHDVGFLGAIYPHATR